MMPCARALRLADNTADFVSLMPIEQLDAMISPLREIGAASSRVSHMPTEGRHAMTRPCGFIGRHDFRQTKKMPIFILWHAARRYRRHEAMRFGISLRRRR